MNAGAYNKNISDVIEEVLIFEDDEFKWISNDKCEFKYRSSYFHDKSETIIIAAKLKFETKNTQEIVEVMENRRKRRNETQPLNKPSVGSVFKNLEEGYVWKYIDDLGLRGFKVGGCKVSEKHTNFIINDGKAKSKDFIELANIIKDKCKKEYNIELEMEVETFNC